MALSASRLKSGKGEIEKEQDYAYKQSSAGADATIYQGSLICYEATTGGLRKAAHANSTDYFAGVSLTEASVAKTGGAAAKSTLDSERIEFQRKGVIKCGTATGAANTAKCTALTNGQAVYVVDDDNVCVKGTGSSLVRVGRQVKYVSDSEVYISLNEYAEINA